mmetsp:Transcript_19605/g.66689  ORF Transcript_19605/g.66689 Transcript_19605/m.66689 type:complete len:322 (+) Transcript_19605:260-1225(+)
MAEDEDGLFAGLLPVVPEWSPEREQQRLRNMHLDKVSKVISLAEHCVSQPMCLQREAAHAALEFLKGVAVPVLTHELPVQCGDPVMTIGSVQDLEDAERAILQVGNRALSIVRTERSNRRREAAAAALAEAGAAASAAASAAGEPPGVAEQRGLAGPGEAAGVPAVSPTLLAVPPLPDSPFSTATAPPAAGGLTPLIVPPAGAACSASAPAALQGVPQLVLPGGVASAPAVRPVTSAAVPPSAPLPMQLPAIRVLPPGTGARYGTGGVKRPAPAELAGGNIASPKPRRLNDDAPGSAQLRMALLETVAQLTTVSTELTSVQ